MENEKKTFVKGYMRPDGTSYYVVVPKEIREILGLTGGEIFRIKAFKEEHKISLRLIDTTED